MDKGGRDDMNLVYFLEYENLPEVLWPTFEISDSFLSIDSILSNKMLLFEVSNNQITGRDFNSIWEIDFINGWDKTDKDLWAYDRNLYMKEMKKGVKCFYLGRTKISNKYETFVILLETEDPDDDDTTLQSYYDYRKLYLFNIKNKKVVSIVNIAQFIRIEGDEIVTKTKRIRHSLFIQTTSYSFNDIDTSNSISNGFKIKKDGCIRILPLSVGIDKTNKTDDTQQ